MAQSSRQMDLPPLQPTVTTEARNNGAVVTLRCFFCATNILPNPLEDTLEKAVKQSRLIKNLCFYFKMTQCQTQIPEMCSQNSLPICESCTAYLERLYRAREIIDNAQKDSNVALTGLQKGVGDAELLCSRFPVIRDAMSTQQLAPLRTLFVEAFCKFILFFQQQNQRAAQSSDQYSGRVSTERFVNNEQMPVEQLVPIVLDPPMEESQSRNSGSLSSEAGSPRVIAQTARRGRGTRRNTRRRRN